MVKALCLFSGGLDSILAVEVLRRQGISVTGISFVTPFFNAEKAKKSASAIHLDLIVQDIGDVHLEMVKNPHYGYGKNLNPCIDCHAMMFRLAGERMQQEGFDFLCSGEVLGQRPMSQNRSALNAVANYSGFAEVILRPLSAQVLPETAMESNGLVDREQLLNLQGRTRKRHDEIARAWELTDLPSAGGGCLLTESSFSNRLRDLLAHHPQADTVDVELLKVGRQFRLSDTAKVTIGRNKSSNDAIIALARKADIRLHCENFPGPVALVTGSPDDKDLLLAGAIAASYGKGQKEARVSVLITTDSKCSAIRVSPLSREETQKILL